MNTTSSFNDSTPVSEEILDFILCGCIDFPKSGVDCSTRNTSICFRCRFLNVYFTRETINDYNSTGHLICRIIAVVTVLLGVVGVFTNFLVILIIRKRNSKRSFDFQLCTLSIADALCCLACISYGGAHIAYYDNLFERDKFTFMWLMFSSTSVLMWRVQSMYLTLMISIERYLAIAYPLRSRTWFSIGKTKLQTVIVTFLVILTTMAGYVRLYVGPNIYGSQEGGLDVPSLREFKYTYLPSTYYSIVEGNDSLGISMYLVHYYIPLGGLFLFNILTYKQCHKLNKRRQELTSSQRQELQPAKMFLPVIGISIFTNIWPSVMLFTVLVWGVNFREVWMSVFLGNVINCSVNFWIFYLRAAAFRRETICLFNKLTVILSSTNSQTSSEN